MSDVTNRSRRILHIVLAVIAAALLVIVLSRSLAGAQEARGIDAGRVIATKLCRTCHVVGVEQPGGTVAADVPSFHVIANRAGQTAEAIAGRIVVPHPPMPQLPLTRDEIAAVSAYILSLRDAKAR